MIDFYDGLALFHLRGFASSKNTETQQCIFYSLRNGLECEVRKFMCLNTGAFLGFLHFRLLYFTFFLWAHYLLDTFNVFMQHLCQTWFQVMSTRRLIVSFQIFSLLILSKILESQGSSASVNPSGLLSSRTFHSWQVSTTMAAFSARSALPVRIWAGAAAACSLPPCMCDVLSPSSDIMCIMRDTFGLLHRERSIDPAQATEKTV